MTSKTTYGVCETTPDYLSDGAGAVPARTGIRVLVVDDQASVRLPLCDDLGEAGFTVAGAASVSEAGAAGPAPKTEGGVLDQLPRNESRPGGAPALPAPSRRRKPAPLL